MVRERREDQRKYPRAGSSERDARHRAGGDWTTITIPDGVSVFQPKDGTYRMDVVPYLVKTGRETPGGNPYARAGQWYWERTYYVHKRVGPNGETWVCPAKTAGKRCPICEHRAKIAKDAYGDQKLVKALAPQERQLFLIHLRDDDDNKEVMLYESSYRKGFGELLDKRRQKADEDEKEKTDFDDPEAGAVLVVEYEEETVTIDSGASFKFVKPTSIEFRPRKNGLDPEILEHGIDLDSLLKIHPYEKLKSLYYQEPDSAESNPKESGSGGNTNSVDKDVEEVKKELKAGDLGLHVGTKVKTRKFGVGEIIKISKDGTKVTILDSNEDVHVGIPLDEVKIVENEDMESEESEDEQGSDEVEESPRAVGKSTKNSVDDEDEEYVPTGKSKRLMDEDEEDWY